jgi:Fic family protein
LRDLWSHSSTALEGNTLTLDETDFILAEGLTISSKPLKDHQEVFGNARTIEFIYELLDRQIPISVDHLLLLHQAHQAVQTSIVNDIYQPIRACKRKPNGTHALTAAGKQTFIDYAATADVSVLMKEWLTILNSALSHPLNG